MTNRELAAWCLLAFIVGLLVGLALSNRTPEPPKKEATQAEWREATKKPA